MNVEPTATIPTATEETNTTEVILKILGVLLLLFIFLIGVNTLSASFKMMGSGFAKTLFDVSSNPVIALFAGLLATALIQSSSTTTSIIVGLVSSGALSIGGAVPMIMGANLGTSVTNTIVSLAYLKDTRNFKRAFSAATVHDIFNILTVIILLPLEIVTGFLEKSATTITAGLSGAASGSASFSSPIKALIKPVTKAVQSFSTSTLGLEGNISGIVVLLIAAGIIIFALSGVVRIMKTFVESNKGDIIEKLLSKNPYLSIFFGMLITIAVQSSSITTSLLVPMAGAGLLSIHSILPVTIGANIGTTTTALLASLTGNVAGLTIAIVHLIFNMAGMLIWFPSQSMRRVPVYLSEKLGEYASKNRMIGFAYIIIVFFILPLTLVML